MHTPWAESDSYNNFGAQYRSGFDSQSIPFNLASFFCPQHRTLCFNVAVTRHAATLDTEPLAKSTQVGVTPTCLQLISSTHVHFVVRRFWAAALRDRSDLTCPIRAIALSASTLCAASRSFYEAKMKLRPLQAQRTLAIRRGLQRPLHLSSSIQVRSGAHVHCLLPFLRQTLLDERRGITESE
jgi:hypothetical protein